MRTSRGVAVAAGTTGEPETDADRPPRPRRVSKKVAILLGAAALLAAAVVVPVVVVTGGDPSAGDADYHQVWQADRTPQDRVVTTERSGDQLTTVTESGVHRYDLTDGERTSSWSFGALGTPCTGDDAAAVTADTAVVALDGEGDDACTLAAGIDLETGKRLWTRKLRPEPKDRVTDGVAVFAAGDVVVLDTYGQVTAVAARTGDRRWATERTDPYRTTVEDTLAGTDTVLRLVERSSSDRRVLEAFDAESGERRWRADLGSGLGEGYGYGDVLTSDEIQVVGVSPPVVRAGRIFYFFDAEGDYVGAKQGAAHSWWQAGDTLVLSSSRLVGVDTGTAAHRWTSEVRGRGTERNDIAEAIGLGTAYPVPVLTDDASIVVVHEGPRLLELDGGTGAVRSSATLPPAAGGGSSYWQVGDRLVVLTSGEDRRNLTAYEPS